MLMQSAITLKDLSSALACQGIRGTELTAQVIIYRKYTKNRSNNFLKAIKLKISCKQTFYANSLIFAEKKIAVSQDPSEKGVGGRALYISPQLGSGKRGGHGL